ncbi:MAG: ATP-binding protein [Selenomonas bovis]|nr:ATP-binding protein [Selenomonas bovis]
MGLIKKIFGYSPKEVEPTTTVDKADIKPKERVNMATNEETVPHKKTLVWTRVLKEENVKLSLQSDAVWQYKKENGEVDIADKALWTGRVNSIFSAVRDSVKKHNAKYCTIPSSIEIVFHHAESSEAQNENQNFSDKRNGDANGGNVDESVQRKAITDQILVREPRWKFSDMYIEKSMLESIKKTMLIARHRKELFGDWNLGNGDNSGRAIVFNFYGPSGTGKSMTGEAIAGELGKKVYAVNYSELESKYVGDTPKNIVAAFQRAQKDDAVLIFDEADSFLGKRLTNVTQSSDYGVNITRSVMLMELEKFDGIVIFTTNLISNYDEAFKRRILTSIPFKMPDVQGRERIWNIYLSRGIPIATDITGKLLANKYNDVSGADIKDMLLYAAISSLYRDESNPVLTEQDFDEANTIIHLRKQSNEPHEPHIVSIKHEKISEEEYKQSISPEDNLI